MVLVMTLPLSSFCIAWACIVGCKVVSLLIVSIACWRAFSKAAEPSLNVGDGCNDVDELLYLLSHNVTSPVFMFTDIISDP
jgi:hypothetical protein